MDALMSYRGRSVTDTDITFIRELMSRNPGVSRWKLSRKLCEAWQWRQPNGAACDMICRGLMLELDRRDLITLPPTKRSPVNPFLAPRKPGSVSIDQSPIRARLREIQPLRFMQVRRSSEEKLFDSLIEEHHYLGYTRPVGEHLKYLVHSGSRPVACFAWGSAPRHLGPRDRFIGWSARARRSNIRFVVYNPRFLILPWVEVAHLASHLLGRMARMLPTEWERIYGHPVYFAETFVDPTRFKGTCYRAANWTYLGQTTGRGKDSQSKRPNRSLKDVLGYPLTRHFRALLSEEP